MKILQWNIWYQEKIQNILEVLKETNADIICLQELTIGHECNSGLDTPKFSITSVAGLLFEIFLNFLR